jgi:hypothetical protein
MPGHPDWEPLPPASTARGSQSGALAMERAEVLRKQ